MTDEIFKALVEAGGAAPSSDNTQPWMFHRRPEGISLYGVSSRLLDIDVRDMYSFISLGAAVENVNVMAQTLGLVMEVEWCDVEPLKKEGPGDLFPVAHLRFSPGTPKAPSDPGVLFARYTDRHPFTSHPLGPSVMENLNRQNRGGGTEIHWITSPEDKKTLAEYDHIFSSILLGHPPFFDGLFNTVQFDRKKLLAEGWGMDIKSLDLPWAAEVMLKVFGSRSLGRLMARWGVGPAVARGLSKRILASGALCLITTEGRSRKDFLEAGRTMQSLWLKATELNLAVHPYGVITQYIHMAELEPHRFPAQSIPLVLDTRPGFLRLFNSSLHRQPVMVLRIGWRRGAPRKRLTIRLPVEKTIG